MTDKTDFRKRFLALRKRLKSPEKDGAILSRFLSSPFFGKTDFFVYHSVGSEADTLAIIGALLCADKRVLLPRIHKGEMLSVPYSKERERVFGIPQPKSGEDTQAEIILTPLVAFDKEGYRLGYGGGYYDRYFSSHRGLRVGLAYEGQAAEFLPREEFDKPLHAVITEAGIRYFN